MTHPVRGHPRGDSYVQPYERSNPQGSGKGGPGAVVAAAGIAVAVAVGSGMPPPPPGPTPAPPSPSLQIKMREKADGVAKNLLGVKVKWQRKGYRANLRGEPDADCAAHSYGKVHDSFVSRDCDYMVRVSGEFRDKNRNVVLVAVSWVEMPTTGEAARLRRLVDTDGTGNVTELTRERGRYRNVRYDGLVYDSGIDGQAVWNVQVQPVGWSPAAVLLNEIRDDVLTAAIEGT